MEGARVCTGVDIVELAEFRGALQRGGPAFRRRLFRPDELRNATEDRLAAIFAAKEAAFKALALPRGDWHVVEVRSTAGDRPSLRFGPLYDTSHIVSCDLAISLSKRHAMACVTALVRR